MMLGLAFALALAWLAFRLLRRGGVALGLGLLVGGIVFGGDVRDPTTALVAGVVVFVAVRVARFERRRLRTRGDTHVVRRASE